MVLVAGAGCTIKQADTPAPSGPSELATSITMYASPDTLRQDGVSQSQITLQARDANGQALKNMPIRLEIAVDGVVADFGQLSGKNVYTGSDGRATALYTSPLPPADPVDTQTVVQIQATPVGSDYGNALTRSVSIRLVPPGIILPPNGTPVPSFVYSPSSPVTLSEITFDASSSQDSDGRIVSYAWNFGDGTQGSGVVVRKQYSSWGSYTVVLTVTDDRGLSASKPLTISVNESVAPVATFVMSPTNPVVNQDVSFNASASTAASGRRITRYDWDFGSGTPQSGMIVGKSYDVAATYTVTLTVTDDVGKKGVSSRPLTVSSGGLTAAFTYSPTAPVAPERVFFDASDSTSIRPISRYTWDFGDGRGGEGQSTSHVFACTGTADKKFIVRLTVEDNTGVKATATKEVTVKNCGS